MSLNIAQNYYKTPNPKFCKNLKIYSRRTSKVRTLSWVHTVILRNAYKERAFPEYWVLSSDAYNIYFILGKAI